MDSQSLNPDLDSATCVVAHCINVADLVATADVRIPVLVGVPEGQRDLVLELPMCVEHAHLLRMGVDHCRLTTFQD